MSLPVSHRRHPLETVPVSQTRPVGDCRLNVRRLHSHPAVLRDSPRQGQPRSATAPVSNCRPNAKRPRQHAARAQRRHSLAALACCLPCYSSALPRSSATQGNATPRQRDCLTVLPRVRHRRWFVNVDPALRKRALRSASETASSAYGGCGTGDGLLDEYWRCFSSRVLAMVC